MDAKVVWKEKRKEKTIWVFIFHPVSIDLLFLNTVSKQQTNFVLRVFDFVEFESGKIFFIVIGHFPDMRKKILNSIFTFKGL